jgi:hypothetical protein
MSARRNSIVTRVVSLCDLATGRPIGAQDGLIEVSGNGGYSLPVGKPDGHFVFVDEPLHLLSMRSAVFEDFDLAVEGLDAAVLRLGLIRKKEQKGPAWVLGGPHYELALGVGEAAWVGFGGPGLGYGLAADVQKGDETLALDKDDFVDLTWRCLAVADASVGTSVAALVLGGSTGLGRYTLLVPASCECMARETEVFALTLVAGTAAGTVALPLPATAQHLYMLRGAAALGVVETIELAATTATAAAAAPNGQDGGAP